MKMLIVVFLAAFGSSAMAQVYSFTPKYLCTSMSDREYKTLSFDDVDTNFNQLIVIDLDKKTITAPGYPSERMEEMAIDEVTHDVQTKTYWIKTRRDKAKDQDKHFFKLKMNENQGKENMPGYLQEITNVYHTSDSLMVTMTNHPEALFFRDRCLFVKSNTALSSDNTTRQTQMNAVYDAELSTGDNFFEMRDGYLTWTKGKGKKAQITQFNVIKATYSKDANSSSLDIHCYVPGKDDETYLVVYTYTYSRFDPSYPHVRNKQCFMLMAKFKDGLQTEEYVFK